MLHLVADARLDAALVDRIATGDDVVLQLGAAWAAFVGHEDNVKIQALLSNSCQVFVMQDFMQAAGLGEQQLMPGVLVADYPALVQLTVAHPVIHTWR